MLPTKLMCSIQRQLLTENLVFADLVMPKKVMGQVT